MKKYDIFRFETGSYISTQYLSITPIESDIYNYLGLNFIVKGADVESGKIWLSPVEIWFEEHEFLH